MTVELFRDSVRNRENVKLGLRVEDAAMRLLWRCGDNCIEKIYTGCVYKCRRWFPVKRVSGDFKAISKDGKHVHVEVKYRDGKLCWSDFKAHQIEALNDISLAKGESLVIWARNRFDLLLFRWPIEGFGPGKSICWEMAQRLASVFDR